MTNIQAALGLAQLENIEKNIEIKRLIGNEYQKHLKDIKNIILPIKEYEYAENIYWVFGVLLTDRNYRYMKEIVDKLKQRGVGTRPFFWPLHLQPVIEKYNLKIDKNACPNSRYLSDRGFYLPSGLGLQINEVKEISNIFSSVLNDY